MTKDTEHPSQPQALSLRSGTLVAKLVRLLPVHIERTLGLSDLSPTLNSPPGGTEVLLRPTVLGANNKQGNLTYKNWFYL